MALWGNKDSKTASGTIAIASNGVVTGTSTSFTTQAKVGNYIRAGGVDYQIVSITSNTVAKVIMGANNGNGAVTTVAGGTSYTLSEKPSFVAHESADSGIGVHGNANKVFGVDATEANVTNRSYHSGWVRRTVGTGGRSGRVFYETLVATGTTAATAGDQADDTQFPDA